MVFTQPAGHQREPASLQLRDESRRVGLGLTEGRHAVGAVGSGRKSHVIVVAVEHLRQFRVAAVPAFLRQAGEDRNVHPAFPYRLVQGFQQFLFPLAVVVVVFVLNLNQDDALSAFRLAGNLFVDQFLAYRIVPVPAPAYVAVVRAPEPESVEVLRTVFGQPSRIAAAGILGADERSRTHDGVEAELVLRHFQPSFQVAEVELSRLVGVQGHRPFVPVPRHVGFHGVESGFLDFPEAVSPQGFGTAEVMEGRAVDKQVLPVDGHARSVIADTFGPGKLLVRPFLRLRFRKLGREKAEQQ